ncbi:unnamed protein product [Symbiodinium sp. CCMP2456]|nr:unnamed protein product [Symbiodinium sp. CCMP2456]
MARHGLPRPGCLLAAALLLVSLLQFQWLDFTAWRSADRNCSSSRLVGWRWQPSVRGQLPAMRLGPGGGSDPVNNVSPEMSAAGRKYAQKYEDIMLAGQKVWEEMLKKDEVPKKIYFIGTNGNTGEMVAEALMDSLAYVPAPDGTLFLRRKPGVDYPKLKYYLLNGDKELAARAPKSPVDLYMEDEKKYRELETEVLKEFQNLETEGQPAGIIVGESAVSIPENVEILKTGLVIWIDVAAEFSWSKTQMRAKAGGGLFIPYEIIRPPVWCIANGWDGDIDDGEAKAEYMDMVEKYNEMYEEVADLRLRADTPGIVENQYWGAERLSKAIAEFYGIDTEGASVEEEVLERDLEKFLESARLSKYMQAALDWCDEQGAASIEDIVENTDDFAEALSLKPLEKKRLAKAAESVAAVA